MSNPLFQQMGQGQMPGGLQQMMQKFQQFQQTFRGDPRQQIQQMLNSGRVTQDQYNQAVQVAQQLQKLMGGR